MYHINSFVTFPYSRKTRERRTGQERKSDEQNYIKGNGNVAYDGDINIAGGENDDCMKGVSFRVVFVLYNVENEDNM